MQISSSVSWGDSLWSEGTAERVSSQSIESPDITSVTIYNVPELVDMILCNQHVQRERKQQQQQQKEYKFWTTSYDFYIDITIISLYTAGFYTP